MQLAASQRAHPPPVPPRPSRQVVAEALKKSPRPPCPTRQAPPPPNQRPWRQDEQQKQEKPESNGTSGRTIVYDSAHLAKPMVESNNKPPEVQPRRGSVESRKSTEDQSRRSSIDKDERKRPVPRDFSKEQVNRVVNGKDHPKDLEQLNIDDTSRRKEKENSTLLINNNNSISSSRNSSISSNSSLSCNTNNGSGSDKDLCDGPSTPTKELKVEGSVERKKKKAHNVTFKEEQIVVEATIEHNNRSPSPPITPEKCATVVVIDEVHGPRVLSQEEHDNIKRQDWLEAGVRYSSTKITLPAEETVVVVNGLCQPTTEEPQEEDEEEGNQQIEGERDADEEVENQLEFGDLDFSSIIERIAMSSLQGLPPLPRSLSGFNLNGAGLVMEPATPPPPPPARSSSKASQRGPKTPTSTTSLSSGGSRPSPSGRQLTTLDTQLAILRREMFGLRQLDLSLLSQLWSLNESIQEFRQLLQEQEDRAPSPSPSSEEGDDTSYSGGGGGGGGMMHPPPPPRRPAPTTPHHRHHYRAARAAARSSKLPPSDESPSSEEYGAV